MKKKGKTISATKEKYLTTNQVFARRDRKLFCKKSNGKSKHSTINQPEDSLQSSVIKGGSEMNSCLEERDPDRNDLKLRLKFTRKVCCKRAM